MDAIKRIKVLWVDNDWGSGDFGSGLNDMKRLLMTLLSERSIQLDLQTKTDGRVLNEIVWGRFDLIILDHILNEDDANQDVPRYSTEVVMRLAKMRLSVPIVIVSKYTDDQFSTEAERLPNNVQAVFRKSTDAVTDLVQFIENLAGAPPINLVVLSDLHAGFLRERDVRAWPSFCGSLVRDMESWALQSRPDFLLISGDLAWRDQGRDFVEANTAISEMQAALKLPASSVHFCPGNHDVNLAKGHLPWNDYYEFVRRFSASDQSVGARFYAFNVKTGLLDRFNDQRGSLTVYLDSTRSVLIACLNSCRFQGAHAETAQPATVIPEIGTEQWDALEQILSHLPRPKVQIAMFHHPLFSAPGGDWEDERALFDQGRALHRLAKLGFGLVIHGHSHFSALYEHRFTVINRAGGPIPPNRMLILSCSTAGAEPNAGAPFRQYYLVQIGHKIGSDGSRPVTVQSRVYSPVDYSWTNGGEIPTGSYYISSTAMPI